MSNYFPFGFQYPQGFAYSDTNPDPGIETLRKRTAFLNECHAASGLPGHIFGAAAKLFQERSELDIDTFWTNAQASLSPADIAAVATSLSQFCADEPPRLDFPNAIAICDCRFVSTLEWQHLRRYSLGGSEAAVVVGKTDEFGDQINGFTQLSHYQSRRGLFYEKQATFVEKPNNASKQQIFDYGHLVEDFVIDKAARLLGAKRRPEYRMFAHRDFLFITCNPDGILEFPDGSFALFEAKTTTRHKRSDWTQGIPDYYRPQPRQYMAVLDDPKICKGYIGCCLGCLDSDWIMHSYQRDLMIEKKQLAQECDYWNRYIVAGVLPPLSGDPELDMEAVYRYSNRTANPYANTVAAPLPASCEPLVDEYNELSGKLKALRKDINTAKSRENSMKQTIELCLPEGLTIIAKPGDVTYKVSITKSIPDSVSQTDLFRNDSEAANACLRITSAMQDDKLMFTTPSVAISKKSTKKGA